MIQYHRELFNKGYCFAEMVENTITTDINLHMHMKTGLRTVFVVPNVSLCFSRMQILDISNKNMEFPHFHLAFIWHTFIIVYPYFFQTLEFYWNSYYEEQHITSYVIFELFLSIQCQRHPLCVGSQDKLPDH